MLVPLYTNIYYYGACGSVLVKALCYKPEGRGFEIRLDELIFTLPLTEMNTRSRKMFLGSVLLAITLTQQLHSALVFRIKIPFGHRWVTDCYTLRGDGLDRWSRSERASDRAGACALGSPRGVQTSSCPCSSSADPLSAAIKKCRLLLVQHSSSIHLPALWKNLLILYCLVFFGGKKHKIEKTFSTSVYITGRIALISFTAQ
jgi:hypothetical protein